MSDIYSYTVGTPTMASITLSQNCRRANRCQVELPKGSIPLAEHKDKTLLFVNVASKCGTYTRRSADRRRYDQRLNGEKASPLNTRTCKLYMRSIKTRGW